METSLRYPGRVVSMVLVAAALNLAPIELPGGAVFFLGPFVVLPLVLTLPVPWGVLAAAVPAAVTIPALGHPFVLLLATGQAICLGLLQRRWRRSSLLQTGVFWLLVGLPLVTLLYGGAAGLPEEIVRLIAVTHAANELAAVAVGVVVLRHTSLAVWFDGRVVPHRRTREMVFHAVFVLALVPLAFVGIGVSVMLRAHAEQEDRTVLDETAGRLTQQLDLFLNAHAAAVTAAANTLGRGGADAGVLVGELRNAHPAFITMLVADATGRITAAAPLPAARRAQGTDVADRNYFRQARDLGRTYVSGVFRGRGFGQDILVAISAPVHDGAGRFAGIVQASLEVHNFARLTVGNLRSEGIELTFADSDGRVIFSDSTVGIRPLARLRDFPQGEVAASLPDTDAVYFDQADAAGRTVRFAARAARSPGGGITVVAERPFLVGYEGSGWVYGLFGVLGLGSIGAALAVERLARRQGAEPLEYFSSCALRQAERRMVEPIESRFPNAPYEVAIVFRAFNELAGQLQGTYRMLRDANVDLDRRVVARTAEAEAARREAEAASRSKTDFLAMTSHEIRTPLNAIIGLAEAVADAVEDPVARERLRTIHHSGRRLLGVVNDLLDLSRVEAGRLELHPAPVELGALCAEVHRLFALRAEQQGLEFVLELAVPSPLWVAADSPRLQQILINLVGNALKFTPGGSIRLRVETESETPAGIALRFAVIDTGPGIPPDQQARLFQPYMQLPGAAASAVPGTGLGLSICRRLVGLFGGALAVRSEVGAGSEFFFGFVLPRVAPPAAESVAPFGAPPVAGLEPLGALRVLVVDDDPSNQEVLRSIMESRGLAVVTVDSAEAALAELIRAPFDVALVDLEMPVADGFDVARAVRGWAGGEASRGCRLVAASAHARAQVWARCRAQGFDDYLEKPVDREELWRVLRDCVAACAA